MKKIYGVILLSAAIATSCARQDGGVAPVGASPGSGDTSLRQAFLPGEADYDPVERPSDLAPQAQAVVIGRVIGAEDGPITDEGSAVESRSLVLKVHVMDVLKGPVKNGDDVYVRSWFAKPETGLQTARTAAASQQEVLLYLERHEPKSGQYSKVTHVTAGRPNGAPLWAPVHPQGFLEEAPGGAACVMEECRVRGENLREVSRADGFLDE